MIVTYKNHLPHAVVVGYISAAPHKTGAGICPPPDTSAQPRERFFYVRSIATPFRFMVGRAGQPQGWPDSSVSGRANPVRLTTPEFCPSVGELSKSSTLEASSWPIANNAALTRIVSTRKPKSIVASIEPTRWHLSCHSTCCASHTAQCRYGCHQSWTTSLTISVRFRRCLTGRRTPRDFPENLTQKQHSASACWWGVRLSDIQEAL
ncbi:ash family protein [Salmonella enterica]|nr:ash family protein [Salmonella enterica]